MPNPCRDASKNNGKYATAYKVTIKANIDPATRPEKVSTLVVSMSDAVLPAAAEPEADPEPVDDKA